MRKLILIAVVVLSASVYADESAIILHRDEIIGSDFKALFGYYSNPNDWMT
jgi:hypothetical protein